MKASQVNGALRAIEPGRNAHRPAVRVSGAGVTVTSLKGTVRANGGADSAQAFTYARDMVRDIALGKASAQADADTLAVTARGLTHHLPAQADALPALPSVEGSGSITGTYARWVELATDSGAYELLTHVCARESMAIATDRYRIHYAPADNIGTGAIPGAALAWLASGAASVNARADHATVAQDGIEVTVRTGLGEFPNFASFIHPEGVPMLCGSDAVDMLRPYLADRAVTFIRFTPEGVELVASKGAAKHESRIPGPTLATLPINASGSSLVRADFMRDALALDAPAVLSSTGPDKPIYVTYASGAGAAVMPIRA